MAVGIAILFYNFGVKPMITGQAFLRVEKSLNWALGKLPKEQEGYDVIVVGEEPEGLAAAVVSARAGAKTLLVAEGPDLGGMVSRCLNVDMETNYGPHGEILNKGILTELSQKLGRKFSPEKYKTIAADLAGSEKRLTILYDAAIDSPILKDSTITGIVLNIKGQKTTYIGKRIIDATQDGELLTLCKVPYFLGSEDLHMKNSYIPLRLNFEIEGVKSSLLDKLSVADNQQLQASVKKYITSSKNNKISDFRIQNIGNNRAIIEGIEIAGVDENNAKSMENAYKNAAVEALNFSNFLKEGYVLFKDSSFKNAADAFYVKEYRHFVGEHILSINEILENKDFPNKIALGSMPPEASKFTDSQYIIGKPSEYAVPLECAIPLNIDNLLMVGHKISYSSLAGSSADSLSINIATGEGAGVAAVFSLTENITPRDLVKQKDQSRTTKFIELLRNEGVRVSDFKIANKNESNWAYDAIKQINSLGLISAGLTNDYRFSQEAKQEDLAILLLNGIYRVSPEKYSLELDARLRPYFIKGKLTKEKCGEILMALYGKNVEKSGAYQAASDEGYLTNEFKLQFKDKSTLTMDQVYDISAYNIVRFTGKVILQ